jgi:hypothetical protein
MSNEETTMQKAERRGKPYVEAVQLSLDWKEYSKTHPIPKEGDMIRVKDPDTKKIHEAKVTRIASNGIRATIINMKDGLISVNKNNDGVWE